MTNHSKTSKTIRGIDYIRFSKFYRTTMISKLILGILLIHTTIGLCQVDKQSNNIESTNTSSLIIPVKPKLPYSVYNTSPPLSPLYLPTSSTCTVSGINITATGTSSAYWYNPVPITNNCTGLTPTYVNCPWTEAAINGVVTYTFSKPIYSATISYTAVDGLIANNGSSVGTDVGNVKINGCSPLILSNLCGVSASGNNVSGNFAIGFGDVKFTVSSVKPFTSITLTNIGGNSGWVAGNLCDFAIVAYPCELQLPILSSNTISIPCMSTTADLTSITASNTPPEICLNPQPFSPNVLTWHSDTPATLSNTVTNLNAVGAGTYYASFYEGLTGCYGPTTAINVTANPIRVPTFNAITACVGSVATLPRSSTNTPPITGTWSPATINTSVAGTTNYTFTPNSGQCAVTRTMTVTVNPIIIPNFNFTTSICRGATAFLPATSTNGFTGTWSPATINTAVVGTTNYTFTPAAGQCAAVKIVAVTVSPSILPTFAAIPAVCKGGTVPILPTSSTNIPAITGTWSPAANSNVTTTYTFTPAAGQCATTTTMTVAVPIIDAIDDDFSATPINYILGGTTPSVLTNDLLNGSIASASNVTVSITSVAPANIIGLTINPSGTLSVPAGAPIGTFVITYKISQNGCVSNFDIATATITILDPISITPPIAFAERANNAVSLIDIQSTSKIIIAGGFTKYNNINVRKLMRLNPDLTFDSSFNMPLITRDDWDYSLPPFTIANEIDPFDMKILSNNKILIAGCFTGVNGAYVSRGIARLNADGTNDPTFNTGGTGINGDPSLHGNFWVRSCVVQPDDSKILIGVDGGDGYGLNYNGTPIRAMIRLNSNGTLDTSFNFPYSPSFVPPFFRGGSVTKILFFKSIVNPSLIPDGIIVSSSGYGQRVFGEQPILFKMDFNGNPIGTFTKCMDIGPNNFNGPNTMCYSCTEPIQKIIKQVDDKIMVIGAFNYYNGQPNTKNIVRLNSDGNVDLSFNPGTSTDRVIKDIVFEPNPSNPSLPGKMIIAGEFTTYNGVPCNRIARLNNDGSLDTTFSPGAGIGCTPNPDQNCDFDFIMALKRQADSKVIVGGYFRKYNNISATNITRIVPSVAGGQARISNNINYKSEVESAEIKVYPNPSNNIFNIDLSDSTEDFTLITVYNMFGQEIKKQALNPNTINSLNLFEMPNGYYFAQLSNENNSIQIKLIKN
jgi:uncharacterized delta-60 repeat protein